ncbi:MAG: hypothetical protein MUC93_12635 [Bacteroidales bacterium]|jgi:hypothetical protein|nr:hypothetical protein [Bacteroidales bacterium]
MKIFSIAIISILLLSFGCKAKKPLIDSQPAMEQPAPVANYSDQPTWLLGYFAREQMYRTPHCEWYLNGYDNYKPVNEYDQLEIQRVPTFIIYENNIEAGRIIENPLTSLEQDIVNILTKE